MGGGIRLPYASKGSTIIVYQAPPCLDMWILFGCLDIHSTVLFYFRQYSLQINCGATPVKSIGLLVPNCPIFKDERWHERLPPYINAYEVLNTYY